MNTTTKIVITQAIITSILLVLNTIQLVTRMPPTQQPLITRPTNTTPYTYVTWEPTRMQPMTIKKYAGKDTPFHQTLDFTDTALQQLSFDLTWTDDRASLLTTRSLDTLTLIVTGSDGSFYTTSAKSSRITRQGDARLTIPVQYNTPQPLVFPTPSTTNAETERISSSTTYTAIHVNYTCIVLVNSDDRSILKRFADQGNDFTLTISPTAYTATVTHTVLNQ